MLPLTPPKPGAPHQGPAVTVEGCFRGDVNAAAETRWLWDALARARANYSPRVLAAAEDAVFRWYLPLARSLATGPGMRAVDPIAVEQAAELGLAQAVLSWRQPDWQEFQRYASSMITERLSCCRVDPGARRPTSVPSALSPLPGRVEKVAPRGAPHLSVRQSQPSAPDRTTTTAQSL